MSIKELDTDVQNEISQKEKNTYHIFSSVQLLTRVRLFATL